MPRYARWAIVLPPILAILFLLTTIKSNDNTKSSTPVTPMDMPLVVWKGEMRDRIDGLPVGLGDGVADAVGLGAGVSVGIGGKGVTFTVAFGVGATVDGAFSLACTTATVGSPV